MLLLFVGLFFEQLGEQRERPLIEMRRNREVLQAGAEFMADLFVEGFRELWAD